MTRLRIALLVLAALLATPSVAGNAAAAQSSSPAAEPLKDTLGRDTPRGTLFGFMDAARKGNFDLAALYLNTPLRDQAAAELAQQLYVVLDTRLPARMLEVSDKPDGSRPNPLKPDQDVIGTVAAGDGQLDILVERVNRGPAGRVWVFSSRTLEAIPAVYDEIHMVPVERVLPAWLMRPRVVGIRLFDWLAFFIVLPLLYRAFGLMQSRAHVPGAARLTVLAIAIRVILRSVDLPLIERQFWTATSGLMLVAALVWFGFMLGAFGERYLLKRLDRSHGDTASLLRLGRRTVDVLWVVAGLLLVLRYYGIDATAALAGLGIGGIAVALSAQKTLENVIGGVSIIFDGAVRIGDAVKIGTTAGTVEYVGLRSTRIRTLDRTLLTIPNGQIATLNIETLSERDKYWFHHFIGITYDATPDQLVALSGDIRDVLRRHARADDASIRVRIVRFTASSIEIEISVYLFAQHWDDFLEQQEALLLDIMRSVAGHGAAFAFPTQTLHVVGSPTAELHGRALI